MRSLAAALYAAVAMVAHAASGIELVSVGEFALPGAKPGEAAPTGLSGMTRVDGDLYYAVSDRDGLLFPMTVRVDRATGAVTGCVFGVAVVLPGHGKRDMESVAWDGARRMVWIGDEWDGSIRAFDPVTGEYRGEVSVPPVYGAFRFNRSFETLAIRANWLEMWTCNEEALCRKDAVVKLGPDVDDGPRATRSRGSVVRLQKFDRSGPQADWRPAGQWAYVTDPIGGGDFLGKARSGVADACCLDDGTILVLEREMSLRKGSLLPSFRCHIYQAAFDGATDVSRIQSLNGADYSPVAKKRLFGQNTGFAMYEGLCLGPMLADGSRSILMISDSDAGAVARLYALRLVGAPSP